VKNTPCCLSVVDIAGVVCMYASYDLPAWLPGCKYRILLRLLNTEVVQGQQR